MKKLLAEHRIAFLLVTVLIFVQSFRTDLHNPYRKPIAGDAQAYYAYLPALFIYHDFEYKFLEKINSTYYVPSVTKSFLNKVDHRVVNKTFPGTALLYAPFFLTAHGISYTLGLPMDGYAYTYQLLFLIGFWVYFLLALIFYKKTLTLAGFRSNQIDLSMALLVLGTNLYFFSVYDQSVTHVFNFFLINLMIWSGLKIKQTHEHKYLVYFMAILSLLCIIRPTNIIAAGILFFFIPEKQFYLDQFHILNRLKHVFSALILPVIIFSIPLLLWKLQTNLWIVYSYGEEGFDFLHPEWLNFLFSYTKGWFVYTPLVLLIFVFGLPLLWKNNRFRFWIFISFYTLVIYLYSSWWCWYYGAGHSQRVMIDYSILIGYLLILILEKLKSLRKIRLTATGLATFLIVLNISQAWQIAYGILPNGSASPEQYWDNFLNFHKRARVYAPPHWQKLNETVVSLNPSDSSLQKGTSVLEENDWILQVDEQTEYSAVAESEPIQFSSQTKLVVAFDLKTTGSSEQSRVAILLGTVQTEVFFPHEYIQEEWTSMEYLIEPKSDFFAPLQLYLWNAGTGETLMLRNLKYTLYHAPGYY